jgi:MbtH protein
MKITAMEQEEYIALINEEGQYSLWKADKEIPVGWKQEGPRGTRDQCLEYIREVWTDMRPLSVRRQMDQDSPKSTESTES